jgi:hypothetical protein
LWRSDEEEGGEREREREEEQRGRTMRKAVKRRKELQ